MHQNLIHHDKRTNTANNPSERFAPDTSFHRSRISHDTNRTLNPATKHNLTQTPWVEMPWIERPWVEAPWWRRSGSNRRPPACKAGALPAELRPLNPNLSPEDTLPPDLHPGERPSGEPQRQQQRVTDHQIIIWWAREDLNLRPHAYQACALTN